MSSFYQIMARMNQIQRSFDQMNRHTLTNVNRKNNNQNNSKFSKVADEVSEPKIKSVNMDNKVYESQKLKARDLQSQTLLNVFDENNTTNPLFPGLDKTIKSSNLVNLFNQSDNTIPNNTSKYQELINQIHQMDSLKSKNNIGNNYENVVLEASTQFGIPTSLINAIIKVESNFNQEAVSNKGAMGLMQLMPKTAQKMSVTDAFDPRQNIYGGVAYLQGLLNKYDGNLVKALAAYNAGEDAVTKYNDKVPNYQETQSYVKKVMKHYMKNNGVLNIKG